MLEGVRVSSGVGVEVLVMNFDTLYYSIHLDLNHLLMTPANAHLIHKYM